LPLAVGYRDVRRGSAAPQRTPDPGVKCMRTLHWLTKEAALQTLIDPGIGAGLFLSARSNQTGRTVPQKALCVSRAISFAIHKDLVVRVLGGF
jgi:hypothetical protein